MSTGTRTQETLHGAAVTQNVVPWQAKTPLSSPPNTRRVETGEVEGLGRQSCDDGKLRGQNRTVPRDGVL